MLQPHDNYNCTKCHSKWMEGAEITEAIQVVVKGLGSFDPIQEIDPLIEREGDENRTIFNATEAALAVLKFLAVLNMIAILEAIPNGKMEMKLILNGTHLMLLTMNRICNFVLKLLFL